MKPGGWAPRCPSPSPSSIKGRRGSARDRGELRRAQQEYYALGRASPRRRRARSSIACAAPPTVRCTTGTSSCQCRSGSSTKRNCSTTRCRSGSSSSSVTAQHQIEAGVEYVDVLREYWVARADLLHLLSGRLPGRGGIPSRWSGGATRERRRRGMASKFSRRQVLAIGAASLAAGSYRHGRAKQAVTVRPAATARRGASCVEAGTYWEKTLQRRAGRRGAVAAGTAGRPLQARRRAERRRTAVQDGRRRQGLPRDRRARSTTPSTRGFARSAGATTGA